MGHFATREEAVGKLKEAYKDLKKAKSVACEKRKEFYEDYIA